VLDCKLGTAPTLRADPQQIYPAGNSDGFKCDLITAKAGAPFNAQRWKWQTEIDGIPEKDMGSQMSLK